MYAILYGGMTTAAVTHLILQYRYWILIPISLLEGPIVAFAAGTLAATGVFNPFVLELFFIVRDLVTDVAYYFLGVFMGKSDLVRRMLHKINVTPEHIEKAKRLWDEHPFRTMALGKFSYGISPSFFIVAGMTRMSLALFVLYNAVIAGFIYGICLSVGYFFGGTLGERVFTTINDALYLIGVVLALYFVFHVVRSLSRKRLLEEEEEQEV